MKYYRIDKMTGEKEEISRSRAKELIERGYNNPEEILKYEQTVPLMTCYIEIEK